MMMKCKFVSPRVLIKKRIQFVSSNGFCIFMLYPRCDMLRRQRDLVVRALDL